MLGVGIIGVGAITRLHLQAFEELPETKVIAVSLHNAEKGQALMREYGVMWYNDYRKMLERNDIGLVSVCTPSGLHGEAAIAAAKAGKHVIVEKPLEVTLDKIDAVIQACDDHRVKLAAVT